MTARPILCIGECMVELSEDPHGRLTRGFGGDTLNTALYLARLGVPVSYVTALGADDFSGEMLAAWAEEGIDTDLIPRLPGTLPGLYLIRTDATGERSFHYWRDSAPVRRLMTLPALHAIAAAMRRAATIYLSGITLSLFDPPSRDRLFTLLAGARAAGAKVAFDTNFRPRGWPDRPLAECAYAQAFATADLVFASVEDHALLFGSADPEAVITRLHAAGVGEIVVKCAEPACHVIEGDTRATIPAAPVAEVIDTTAAGDSFAAAYLAARRTGRPPAEAAAAGHRLAARVIAHRGAIIPRTAMPQDLT